jgi:hypothetical protein
MKLQTFIFVHNQDIIIDYINVNKFSELGDVTYVFLGNQPTDKITGLNNVIICRDLEYNIESYPKFTSFTGWYALWKNNLIKSDFINLFEYDINLNPDFNVQILFNFFKKYKVFGYIPLKVSDYNYVGHQIWIQNLNLSIEKNYGININNFIKSLDSQKIITMTSNHTFKYEVFCTYMEWMEKMIDDIKESHFSGHEVERSISLFYLLKNIDYIFLPNLIHHFQFDSHGTQGISKNKFEQNYKYLL